MSTGVASCDAYLTAYKACEDRLADDIAAGELRPYKSERGWVLHIQKTPERAVLADACKDMLAQLKTRCP